MNGLMDYLHPGPKPDIAISTFKKFGIKAWLLYALVRISHQKLKADLIKGCT